MRSPEDGFPLGSREELTQTEAPGPVTPLFLQEEMRSSVLTVGPATQVLSGLERRKPLVSNSSLP